MKDSGDLVRLAALRWFADEEIEKAKTAVDPTEHLRDAQAALSERLN